MRRVSYIFWLIVVFYYPLFSQITSIDGELRYNHQYQDAINRENFYSYARKNPSLTLGVSGYIFQPDLATLSLRTSLNASYNKGTSSGNSFSSRQHYFTLYDFNMNALRNYFVKINYSARENKMVSSNNLFNYGEGLTAYKQREQSLNLSSDKISFLPTTNLMYKRTRTWSDSPSIKFDQVQQEFVSMFSTSSQSSSVSVVGNLNYSHDKFTDYRTKYFRLQMNGLKEISKNHRLDVNSEYYNFDNASIMSGVFAYSGVVDEKFRLNTSVLARNFLTKLASNFSGNLTQNIQYLQNENFNYFLNLNGQFGTDVFQGADSVRQKNISNNLGGSASVIHMRKIAAVNFSNSLVLGYSTQEGNFKSNAISAGINNSLTTPLFGFEISGSQGFSVSKATGYLGHTDINNNANMAIVGPLPYEINSQTTFDFRAERQLGNIKYFRNLKTFRAQQSLNSTIFYIIQLNINLGGNVFLDLNQPKRKSYGLNLILNSGNLVITGLSMSYRLNRNNDFSYIKPTLEQAVEFTYQWRALAFQLRLQEFRYIDKRREIWFSVTRPFNIGL